MIFVTKGITSGGLEVDLYVNLKYESNRYVKTYKVITKHGEGVTGSNPFKEEKGFKCITLDNKFSNEKILKVKQRGVVKLKDQSQNLEDLKKIGDKEKEDLENKMKKDANEELESLTDDTEIKLRRIFTNTGSTISTSLENVKNNYTEILLNKMANTAFKKLKEYISSNQDGDFVGKISYGKLKELAENNEKERKEKEDKREKERKDIFQKAKETGKPQVLSRIFMTENDIPKEYRDFDSDMGHLIKLAMPDGTEKEDFSHAY